MSAIKFGKQINALNFEDAKKIVTQYLNMDMSYFYGCCDTAEEKKEEEERFLEDFKTLLRGKITVDCFYQDYWMEGYDGESVQSFFHLYDFLNSIK